jgi:ribonucleoside-triphosphate reductase
VIFEKPKDERERKMAVSKKSKKVIDPGTFSSIIKRNGVTAPFDAEKIRNAIFKANIQIADERISDDALNKLTSSVIASMPAGEIPTVEQIQDKVEEKLIAAGYAKTAKAYIIYRAEHTKIREMDQNLMKIYEDLTFKPSAEADLKRENANIDADTAMGTMLKYGSEGAKCFYNTYVLPPDIAQAHRSGDIHIHDMDFYALTETCCQIDLIKLFHGGFSTGHGFLREPTISAARGAGLYRDSGQPERNARRPECAEL